MYCVAIFFLYAYWTVLAVLALNKRVTGWLGRTVTRWFTWPREEEEDEE